MYTVLALVFGTEAYLFSLGTASPVNWFDRTLLSFAPWYAWALVTPVIVRLTRHYRDSTWSRPRVLLAHAVTIVALAPVVVGVNVLLASGIKALQGQSAVQHRMIEQAPWTFWLGLTVRVPAVYAAIAGATYTLDFARRLRRREIDAARLESQLHQAQLRALKAQLQPHFLFNTLNAISTLIRDDPAGAERMVALLADFLRAVMHESGRPEVALREELGLVEKYLAIQQVRFAGRLRVEVSAAADVMDALVPNLVLQPLVENALRHGITPRAAGGTVSVTASREDESLVVEVVDDGVGPRSTGSGGIEEGVGLANTRARLAQLHGGKAEFRYGPAGGSGFRVRLSVPLRWSYAGDSGSAVLDETSGLDT